MKMCAVDNCKNPAIAKELCRKHYWRNHRHGSPYSHPGNDGEPIAWLSAHILYEGEECLLWPFGHGNRGYGSVRFRGKTIGAHRAMCILAHGDPGPGEEAAHSCGKGHIGCVNPNHLRWASRLENTQDWVRHITMGIAKKPRAVKLSDAQCREIAASPDSLSVIADAYKISPSLASRIKSGQRRRLALAKSPDAA